MPRLESIEFLTTTVEAGSFAAAARRLKVTPSAVSRRVAALERELGVPLLHRTTRVLRLTHDGQAFYERCARALRELNEARDVLLRASEQPAGLLQVDVPNALGRAIIAPALPAFLDRYPAVRVHLTVRDQFIDPVAEGIDVVVRVGRLGDSQLIARKLGESRVIHCAAPAYIERRGRPMRPRDLVHHDCVGYLREGQPEPFQFVGVDGTFAADVSGPCHANDAGVLLELALAGRGVVALFDFVAESALARGALVAVLDDYPSTKWPIHALYARNRHLLPKVSVFLAYLSELFRSSAKRVPRVKRR